MKLFLIGVAVAFALASQAVPAAAQNTRLAAAAKCDYNKCISNCVANSTYRGRECPRRCRNCL
jgi:hypothetical protein